MKFLKTAYKVHDYFVPILFSARLTFDSLQYDPMNPSGFTSRITFFMNPSVLLIVISYAPWTILLEISHILPYNVTSTVTIQNDIFVCLWLLSLQNQDFIYNLFSTCGKF